MAFLGDPSIALTGGVLISLEVDMGARLHGHLARQRQLVLGGLEVLEPRRGDGLCLLTIRYRFD
jgi:hypothetical protein